VGSQTFWEQAGLENFLFALQFMQRVS